MGLILVLLLLALVLTGLGIVRARSYRLMWGRQPNDLWPSVRAVSDRTSKERT
jgi:hypothetical protein